MRDKSKYRLIKLMLVFLVGIFMLYHSGDYAKADTTINEGVYQIGDNVYVTFEGDMATISGEGSTWDYYYDGYDITGEHFNPFLENSPVSVIVDEGITGLGDYIFNNRSYKSRYYSVKLPSSLTRIGKYAFSKCYNLKEIDIPEGVKELEDNLFYGCSGLASISFSESITKIGNETFAECGSLENITIPDSVKEIGERAFYDCIKLQKIKIPEGITKINESTFAGCRSLEQIELPKSIKLIGAWAFDYCCDLENIQLPDTIEVIGLGAFKDCTNLKSIVLPSKLTILGDSVFLGCSRLNEIILSENIEIISFNCFEGCVRLANIYIPRSINNILDDAFLYCNNVTINAPKGSYSEMYAINNNMAYSEICAIKNVEGVPKVFYFHNIKIDPLFNPTCTETGLTEGSHCEICNEVIKKQEIIPSKGHNWNEGIIEKEATCTEDGIKTYKCKDCNEVKREKIESLGHDYSEEWTIDKEATCTTSGIKSHHCTRCDEKTDVTTIKALGHSGKKSIIKATVSKDGKITTTCTKCNKVTSSSIVSKISEVKLSTTSYTYNGKVKTPTIIIKDKYGKVLKKNTDYTVTYASGRKNVGKYTVKVTFKGYYSGTKSLSFTIKPKGVSLSSVTSKSKGFVVKWKRQSIQTTGYEIQYSTSSKFSNSKTIKIKKNSSTSSTISKLTKNKKYYIRIRTYKNDGNTVIYSSWSGSKSVKIK